MGALIILTATRHPTDGTKVRVYWSEPANAGDAATSGNYTFNNGVTVSAAAVVANTNNMQADLTVSTLAKTVAYTVTVANVRDIAGGTPISAPRNQTVFTWLGIGDNNLDGIPLNGGPLSRKMRALIGDRPLGYNVLGTVDTTAPIITNMTPASGSNILNTQVISFDCTDDVGFRRIVIKAFYADGTWDLVFDGDSLGPMFQGVSNTVTGIAKGFHFTILRDGGWKSGPNLTPYAIDTSGNEAGH